MSWALTTTYENCYFRRSIPRMRVSSKSMTWSVLPVRLGQERRGDAHLLRTFYAATNCGKLRGVYMQPTLAKHV
jgi:hypothetical protein